ncbi:uncharacterized protein LOC121385893 [Gigantopelta aegis]|uniref:uncharacterized protein LOC121385893 n=1 Tax=Gigantopelta aegis TaxID=1735272 RepID=UPI001B88AB6E|nr:uncharacterized protein LOC121385893 [Gigantopelta aegis]
MLQNKGIFNEWLSLPEGLYYNITFQFLINHCLHQEQNDDNNDPMLYSSAEEDEPVFQPRDSMWTGLWNVLRVMYGVEKIQNKHDAGSADSETVLLKPACRAVIDLSVHQDLLAVVLVNSLVLVFLSLICGLIGICAFRWIYRKLSKGYQRVENPTLNKIHEQRDNNAIIENEQGTIDTGDVNASLPNKKSPVQLTVLYSSGRESSNMVSKKTDTESFLHWTIDQFLVELDKSLGIGSNSATKSQTSPVFNESNSASSLQSPRLQRRSSWRRPKHPSPSLPFGSFNFATDSAAANQAALAWHEIDMAHARHQWQLGDLEDIDLTSITDKKLKDILLFYQRNCPLNAQQWFAASLMVNYVLLLLEKEICQIQTQSPLTVVQLKGIGSMSKGLKIGKAGQFDCLMIVTVNGCQALNVFHHAVSPEISPGRLVLGVQEGSVEYKVREKNHLLRKVSLGEDSVVALLPKEVLAAAHAVVEKALNNLGTKHKIIMDRLPFTIHKSQSAELVLSLDTRILHGLGLGMMEINIRLVPAVPLLCESWSLLPTVYAVPQWNIPNPKTKTSTRQARLFRNSTCHLDSEFFWHLSCSDLETAYLSIMDQRFELSGIHGCHKICLQVLKALFSSSFKTSLLSRGEVKSFQLETILFFLLLESNPHHWTLDELPNRMSDSIHFLRSALQSTWLPNFFIHNPHLEKQMPAMKMLTVLHGGRQDNLLTDLHTEMVDKIINFIKDRLQETGLSSCVKEEFSSEMWEYEFFIFG